MRGIVSLGGVPVTFYPHLQNLVKTYRFFTSEVLLDNAEGIHEQYTRISKGQSYTALKDKYQTISLFKLLKSSEYENMFLNMRNFPKTLKFIAFGKNDPLFIEELQN